MPHWRPGAPGCGWSVSDSPTLEPPRNCRCRERKWKLGQAKRYGRLCARSNLDLESRAAAKAKQEAAAIRRRSAFIAKEACPCPQLADI